MKALRKKYGKKPWIDTPNAEWFRKRRAQCCFLNSAAARMIAAVGYNNVQQIRCAQMASHEKALALAEAIIATHRAMAEASKIYKTPDPNNP